MPSFSKPVAFVGAILALAWPCSSATPKIDTLVWTPCPDGYYCGDLYFCCNPDDTYGYKASPAAPCVPGAAPIIRSVPGVRYNLTIHNTCTVVKVNPVTGMPLNSTNLHVHGVHTSGEGSNDNVMRLIDPGMCLWQLYDFAIDHSQGTNWYHPHLHGNVFPQVAGGAFGMWIVDDLPKQPASGQGYDTNVALFLSNKAIERQLLVTSTGLANGNWATGTTLQLVQNQWHYLRILHVIPSGAPNMPAWFWAPLRKICQIYELATDGVFFSKVPYQPFGSPNYDYQVHAASRLDLAVKCSQTGLFSAYVFAGNTVADFNVVSGMVGPETPFATGNRQWSTTRPNYLADLTDGHYPQGASVAATFAIVLGDDMTINGMRWDPNVPTAALPYGDQYIQQFSVQNSDDHSYHIHQQRFQVVQKGGCGLVHREGEWYDTITNTVVNQPCLVRLRMVDFTGKIIHHCHNLEHEDDGMMGWFDVPFAAPGSFEASPLFVPVKPQYTCPATAGSVAKSSTVDSTTAAAQCEALPVYPWVIMGISLAVAAISVGAAVFFIRRSSHMKMAVFEEMERGTAGHSHMINSPAPSSM